MFGINICGVNRRMLFIVSLALSAGLSTWARVQQPTSSALSGAVLVKVEKPPYPPLARAARITGDVNVAITVRTNGAVGSAEVISGHPLLREAAATSAMKSQFECRNCAADVVYRITYTFVLEPKHECCGETVAQQGVELKTNSGNEGTTHVTITAEPLCICDPPAVLGRRVRSIRCLYLWKCGWRQD